MKFDICIDGRMINHSGIGTYLKALLPVLDEHYNIAVLGDQHFLKDYLRRGKVISFNSKIYSISEQLEYPTKIPPCTVFWSSHYNVPLRKIKARVRIVTIHDVYHLSHSDELSIGKKLYAKVMYKAACDKSTLITTVSEFSKQEILKYVDEEISDKIRVIPNALPDLSKHVPSSLSQLMSDYNIQQPFILSVGNFKVNKNLSRLIAAFCEMENNKDLMLVLVGENKNLITKDPLLKSEMPTNVICTGKISENDLFGLYQNTALFCFPSLYEGFGYPLLEARYFNAHIACSNLLPHREVAGSNALLFDPYSVEDIKKSLEKGLKSSKTTQMEKIPDDYSIQTFTDGHLNIISDINQLVGID